MRIPAILRRIEFPVLMAGLIVAGGLWGLVELLQLARSPEPHALDIRILLVFREPGTLDDPLGPLWLEEAMRDITALGSSIVLVLLTVTATLFLLIAGRRRTAGFVVAAVLGGQIISSVLKLGVDRPRPDLVPHMAEVYTQSFPSGHAMLSAVTYLTLGALLANTLPGRAMKGFVMATAVGLTFLVGLSRVYLGVHWPSDVLAGWCAGFAWAMLCWLLARQLRRREGDTGD